MPTKEDLLKIVNSLKKGSPEYKKVCSLLSFFDDTNQNSYNLVKDANFSELYKTWMDLAVKYARESRDIRDILKFITLHCFEAVSIEGRLIGNLLKIGPECGGIGNPEREQIIGPLLGACTSLQRQAINKAEFKEKINETQNVVEKMKEKMKVPSLLDPFRKKKDPETLKAISAACADCKAALSAGLLSESPESKSKALPEGHQKQQLSDQQYVAYTNPTAPEPPPPYYAPYAPPPYGSAAASPHDTQQRFPRASAQPQPQPSAQEIQEISALLRASQAEEERKHKEAISSMLALTVTSETRPIQDQVICELKKSKIPDLPDVILSTDGLKERSTLRIAQVASNKHLKGDHLTRGDVNRSHQKSPFCASNPLVVYKEASDHTADQISISYGGQILSCYDFILRILETKFGSDGDRTFTCTPRQGQPVFCNVILLKDEREDYQNNQQGRAMYKIECASGYANVQKDLPKEKAYSFGRIALELNADNNYYMMKDDFLLVSVVNDSKAKYFFGKNLYEATGISDSAFLQLHQSQDFSHKQLSDRIRKDQGLVITFSLVPKPQPQRQNPSWGEIQADGADDDLDGAGPPSHCEPLLGRGITSGVTAFTTTSDKHTFSPIQSVSLAHGNFDVKHITLDIIGTTVMNRQYVETNDLDSVVKTYQRNLEIRMRMLENSFSSSPFNQGTQSLAATASAAGMFRQPQDSRRAQWEAYQQEEGDTTFRSSPRGGF